MPHGQEPLGGFAADCEGFRQKIVQNFPCLEPLPKFGCLFGEGEIDRGVTISNSLMRATVGRKCLISRSFLLPKIRLRCVTTEG